MTPQLDDLRQAIRKFEFRSIFINELGWDNYQAELPVTVDGRTYRLRGVAQKRGFAVFGLQTAEMLPGPLRNKIETQVARTHRLHILIFSDAGHTRQVWLWALREIGRPITRRSFEFHAGQSGEALARRLDALAFSLAEEDDLTLVEVAGRVRAAFNVERATKKFYDQFRKERDAFEEFVSGIPDVDMKRWYVSVMLNRLMFVYFIQKKGFLDGDADYLRNRLAMVQAVYGQDRFDRFYRYFLLRLFHEGLARPAGERAFDPELERLIGRVPYLNGGIFQTHEVEARYTDIQIPDKTFGRIFDFFDQYQWHLDDRPLRDDREINPDVLGYIFEKYINQKQMGAYYTREDITEYISKNTIIPFLFDRAREGCRVAFEGENSVWSPAAADPDRYIHEAVGKGAELALPDDIAAGLDDVSARTLWNTPTPDEYALPTEIWRETVARRQRYEAVRARLAAGEIGDINDFITHNLDIRQFAQDVVEQAEGPDLLVAFWQALTGVSVLDPTCGSGAFLFAALNVLEPLYEAAVGRMREFLAEEGWSRLHPRHAERFGKVLADIERHPNETYFIQKSIIINNLYGVDIMAEAVEIAKLRLFLKLAAQVERVEQIEPLPDIDFNIRAGNTLVGYVKREEVRDALTISRDARGGEQRNLLFGETQDALAAVEEKAADIDRLYAQFRAMQTGDDGDGTAGDLAATKAELQRRLAALNDELDRALARQYGVDPDKAQAFAKWRDSHQPFHWFTEYYGILHNGGFDVVIGNPPYVETRTVANIYTTRGFSSTESGNLFALVSERSMILAAGTGFLGLILPISAICTRRTASIQELFKSRSNRWYSAFDVFPARVFEGAAQRISIVLLRNSIANKPSTLHTTKYYRWYQQERAALTQIISYTDVSSYDLPTWTPRIEGSTSLLERVSGNTKLGRIRQRKGNNPIFVHRIINNFIKAVDFAPYFRRANGEVTTSDDFKRLYVKDDYRLSILAVLNSSLFYWYWRCHGDGFHCGYEDMDQFPISIENMDSKIIKVLSLLGEELSEDLARNSEVRTRNQTRTGLVELQTFFVPKSKPLIDKVDRVLSEHYPLSPNELDYIINYDIKYRMGDELFEEGDSDTNEQED